MMFAVLNTMLVVNLMIINGYNVNVDDDGEGVGKFDADQR